jgi:hypothetical protein
LRPFTPSQRRENDAFLAALHRTGNARLSAREAGVKYSTMQHRRGGHPDFASRWDIALVDAHARFHAGGGKGLVSITPVRSSRAKSRGAGTDSSHTPLDFGHGPKPVLSDAGRRGRGARDERVGRSASALRTEGGEPLVVRTKSGRLQVRPAHVGKLTQAAEQLFLQALSATANVRLSAAAAGASVAAFYRRRRQKPGFAREWRLALETGYVRLEAAAIMAVDPESHEDDAWRDNDPPPIPPMTASQALQLLFLHRESVRQGWVEPRPRRGESDAVYIERLRASWMTDQARTAEREALRRALEREEEAPPELPPLPALDQVRGWSRASGRPPYHPGVALFGGWRIGDIRRKS